MLFISTNEGKREWYEGILQTLFEENYKKAYRIAYKMTFDKEMARDATQEAFLKAFLSINTLRDKNKFSAWLYAITVNVCNDFIRQKIVLRDNSVSIFDDEGNTKEYIVELRDFNIPEKVYEDKEVRRAMKKCIHDMPADVRQILILRIYRGLSYSKIAEQMNMNKNTIKTKIHRAKERICKRLRSFIDLEKGERRNE